MKNFEKPFLKIGCRLKPRLMDVVNSVSGRLEATIDFDNETVTYHHSDMHPGGLVDLLNDSGFKDDAEPLEYKTCAQVMDELEELLVGPTTGDMARLKSILKYARSNFVCLRESCLDTRAGGGQESMPVECHRIHDTYGNKGWRMTVPEFDSMITALNAIQNTILRGLNPDDAERFCKELRDLTKD